MNQLDAQATKDRMKKWTDMFHTMQSGFQRVISDFLHGTKTLGQTITGLFQAIGDAIIELIAEQAAKWLVVQLEQLAFGKTAAVSTVATQAAIAGASGIASFAGAPWPIDLGAPAFGAAMAAAATGYAGLASAAGGYDIPAGVNPLVQAHSEEMVLPAPLANAVRDMAGGNSGRGSNVVLQPKNFGRNGFLFEKKALTRALKKIARNNFKSTR
jgi:hypothetical protein